MSELFNNVPDGTYVGVRVDKESNSQITSFISKHNVPVVNSSKEDRRHVTLIYSRVHIPTFVANDKIMHLAKAVGYELFDYRSNDQPTKCLVMLLSAPTLEARHRDIMSNYNATYDFPIYRPHITLSYSVPTDFDIGQLPIFAEEIKLSEEYSQDLDLTW